MGHLWRMRIGMRAESAAAGKKEMLRSPSTMVTGRLRPHTLGCCAEEEVAAAAAKTPLHREDIASCG